MCFKKTCIWMHLKDWRSFQRDNWRRNVSAEAGGWTIAESSCTRATDLDFAAKGTLSKVREVPQKGWELDPKTCLYKFSELLPFGSFEPMDQVHILKAHYCNSSLFNTGTGTDFLREKCCAVNRSRCERVGMSGGKVAKIDSKLI